MIAAVCAEGPVPGELVAPDGAPGLSVAAGTALTRARRRAAARDRVCRATDLALALLDAGRSATLLTDLGVDRDDLADVLAREDLDLPVTPAVRATCARACRRRAAGDPAPGGADAPRPSGGLRGRRHDRAAADRAAARVAGAPGRAGTRGEAAGETPLDLPA